jgi:hypothetical protein
MSSDVMPHIKQTLSSQQRQSLLEYLERHLGVAWDAPTRD